MTGLYNIHYQLAILMKHLLCLSDRTPEAVLEMGDDLIITIS